MEDPAGGSFAKKLTVEARPFLRKIPLSFCVAPLRFLWPTESQHPRGETGFSFDSGLIDAAVGLEHLTGERALASLGQTHRLHQRVFLMPPRPEIYLTEPGAASWIGLRCYQGA